MKRKGFATIELVVTKANQYFRVDTGSREGRKMLEVFVSSLLLESNNYRGFRYLHQEEVPEGHLPGIIFDASEDRQHQYPDDSRISFY